MISWHENKVSPFFTKNLIFVIRSISSEMSVPRLAMKKLVTFCMWCEEATTQMTRTLPTTEIKEMVPYRVQSKIMIPEK